MILIAESGSSKTDWRMISPNGEVSQAKTIGLNPYYQTTDSIIEELQKTYYHHSTIKQFLKFFIMERVSQMKKKLKLFAWLSKQFFQQ